MSVWNFVRDPASVRLLVTYGEQRGVAAPRLLRGTGLVRSQLDDPSVELEASQELMVVANLLRALKHPPLLGLDVGMQYGFTTYGIWGYGLISSATIGEALTLALRFLPLTYAFTLISAGQAEGQLILKFGEPDVEGVTRRFLVQRDLAAAARLVADLVGHTFRLSRVMLMDAQPNGSHLSGGVPTLCGAPIEFGSHMDALMLDPVHLQTRLPNANALTAAMCQQLCMSLIERRRAKQGAMALVRSCLHAACGNGLPDLRTLAKHLYMSERTLKRRLQAEGTSFRQLLAEVRSQLAQDMLADGALSMSEIATRLGYADQSSFSQAFKRRHGVAPSLLNLAHIGERR